MGKSEVQVDKIREMRKSFDALTDGIVTYLNRINRLLAEIERDTKNKELLVATKRNA